MAFSDALAYARWAGEEVPTEAAEMSGVVTAYVKTIEANEMERRLRALEEGLARNAKFSERLATVLLKVVEYRNRILSK